MEQHFKETSEEMNLYDLWKVIAKRKRLIIGLFLLIVVSTAIISSIMQKIYRGEAVLDILISETIPAKEIADIIGNVDREKRKRILPKSGSSVTDLTLKSTKESKDRIVVIIDAKNVDDIPIALQEVIDYINNIDIVKMTVKEESERLLKRSTELSSVIELSSDLSNTYDKLLKAGKLVPVGFNPVDLNKRISDIKLEQLIVEQNLQKIKQGGIGIASQPYISNRPVKPRKMLNIALAGVTSLFWGIVLSFFMEYVGKIKKGNSS